jgi:hypothetical protein
MPYCELEDNLQAMVEEFLYSEVRMSGLGIAVLVN